MIPAMNIVAWSKTGAGAAFRCLVYGEGIVVVVGGHYR
jgi:hypothetical protein